MTTKNGLPTTGSLFKNFFGSLSGFFLETGNMITAFKSYQKADDNYFKGKYLRDTFLSASLAIEHLNELVTGPLGVMRQSIMVVLNLHPLLLDW